MKNYVYPENGKFIYKNGNSYQIIKQYRKNGKMIQKYYGSFTDYNKAILHRDKLLKHDWDDSMVYKNPMKYITKHGKCYQIQYKGKHYGTYTNITDAIHERDLLINNDWHLEKVCELVDDTITGTAMFLGVKL